MGLTCIDESRAIAFVAGELPGVERESVEAHIGDCDSCRRVLAALVRQAAGSAPTAGARTAAQVPDGTWTDGARVGRYVVRGKLGRGGMGSVYRADDQELVRPVALKRLHAEADSHTRARLGREARAAAQLAHPNVLAVYEVGEADGTPFIAMELVDGVTLSAWLAEPRAWREIVAMFAQAGRGLEAAHETGIVHRDFKPDNVLVDRKSRARVADFGLARMWDGDGREPDGARPDPAGLMRMTATGALSGTPAYMAPELVEGRAPNAASDQYAFGVALHEALHGQHPFAGSTPTALWTEMAAGHVRTGGRRIPDWLERVVRRAMAVKPGLRWPSMTSLLAALERPPRKTWPFVAGAAAIAVASLAVAIVALLSSHDRARPESAPAPAAATAPAPADAASPPRDTRAILDEAGYAGMNGQYAHALSLAQGVLADDPDNQSAKRVVVYAACSLRWELVQDKGNADQITKYEALARLTNQTLDPPTRGIVHSECARDGVWLEGDIEEEGSHRKWHAGAKPPPVSAPPTRIVLNNIALDYTQDPAGALEQLDAILAKEPTNAQALRLATVVACDVHYELGLHGGAAADLAESERIARTFAAKLTPRDRWLVWSECDRWGGIWLEGDVDKKGDGTIEHIGPRPARPAKP